MTSRQRLLAAVDRKEPDRVPADLASTTATTLTHGAYLKLRSHLGLPGEPQPSARIRRSSVVIPEEEILLRMDVDARPLLLGGPDLRTEQITAEGALIDEWGGIWTRAGDGHFINTDGPFKKMSDPSVADLDRFDWPDPHDPGRFRGLRERARALHEGTDFAIVLTIGIGPVHISQFLRGWTEYMEDLVERPAFAEALMDHVVDFWVAVTERALAEAGEFVDIVVFLDDVGGQRAPLMKPEMYRRMIKPRHRRLVESGKRHGKRVLWHTCGSVYALIPDLIDIGIDALNPVQVSAAHMDPKRLKREFGRDLAFWGGIDTHRVLPFGTPADVCDEVKRLIEDLASGGGYVLGAVHNIQPDVPPENILALYTAPRNPDAPRNPAKTGDSPRVSGFSVQEDRP